VPEAYGGSPARYKLYLAVVKIMSEACASTGIIYATNFHAMKPLIDFGSEEQKQRLLPRIADGGLGSLAITEPEAGSDATAMRTRFTPDGDYIVVDGGKTFITSGDIGPAAGVRQVERDRRRQGRHLGAGAGEGHARILDRHCRGQDGAARLLNGGARLRQGAACRAPTCWGSRATGSRSCSARSTSRARASRRMRSASPRRLQGHDGLHEHAPQSGGASPSSRATSFLLADLASELAMCEAWLDHVADLVDGGATDVGIEASIAKLRAPTLPCA
jgi:alkylation response protein AidB-like acyl-CoA dehydrogenase